MLTFAIGLVVGGVGGMVLALAGAFAISSTMRSALLGVLGMRNSAPKADFELGAVEQELNELRREQPEVAQVLDSPPAVEPEAIPAVVELADVNAGRVPPIGDPHLSRLLSALRGWHPRSTNNEAAFQTSMKRHLMSRGVLRDDIVERHNIAIRLGEEAKKGTPDFVFWKYLLVEIKGHVESASTSDRAIGQMFRYMLGWKQRGPALLVICGECDPLYRLVIKQYVDVWRGRFRFPICVMFADELDRTLVMNEERITGDEHTLLPDTIVRVERP